MNEAAYSTGIILMNLGSPDSTRVKDVRTYLNEFLMDERVIDIPALARFLLVKGIIVPLRAPKSAKAYASIWTKEGSPLIVISNQLKEKVEERIELPVELAMRYGNPSPAIAFNTLAKKYPSLKQVVLVPLYPHYAMSSYETAVEYAKQFYNKGKYSFELQIVPPFYRHPAYVNALAESMRPYTSQAFDHMLFSYHGIPERHVKKTDITGKHCLQHPNCCDADSPAHAYCYRHQCFTTTKLVAEILQLQPGTFSNSFQSRLGRDPWLQPFTVDRLRELPKQGVKNLLIACPAFVSDCLETLEEIAEEGKEIFLHAGGEKFTLIPCMNTQDKWVDALNSLVLECSHLPASL